MDLRRQLLSPKMTSSALETASSVSAASAADGSKSNIPKSDSQDDTWSSTGYNYINPFIHKLEIDDSFDIAKIYLLTAVLFPLRVVGCILSLITAWMFACIGLCGVDEKDLKEKPFTGWRRQFKKVVAASMRMVFAIGSFHSIRCKGVPATPKEAPILVVAPHSSFADSIVVVATGPPSIVAKHETSQIPLLGKIINYSQPIYVSREDPNSRQNTIREIVARARSEEDWPQVIIFPEGTCTNRSALIKFKPGAFYPGVPVQPVLLKYPNKYDTYTWTWDGPGVLKLLWLTLAKLYSNCEIEFLPVYKPSEEEKADANLYAKNVRQVMARALGVPTSEFSFEDVIMMNRARDMKIPFPGDIVEIERTIYNLGFLDSNIDSELASKYCSFPFDLVDIDTFSKYLKIDPSNPHLYKLFTLLDHKQSGTVSLKSFLLCSFYCKKLSDGIFEFLRVITNIYSESSQIISRESFKKLMRHCSKLPSKKCDVLFLSIDYANKGSISFDDFERYCKVRPDYKFLFEKQEKIRRIRK